jgi:hypothetical protein
MTKRLLLFAIVLLCSVIPVGRKDDLNCNPSLVSKPAATFQFNATSAIRA